MADRRFAPLAETTVEGNDVQSFHEDLKPSVVAFQVRGDPNANEQTQNGNEQIPVPHGGLLSGFRPDHPRKSLFSAEHIKILYFINLVNSFKP